jgi:deoxyribodipyrimidine photo-lyase
MSGNPIIVWFTQDLRLGDNAALSAAAASGRPLLPVYILDDDTPADWTMGAASRWWLEQSLGSLHDALQDRGGRLVLRRGKPLKVLEQLARETGAHGIWFSRNYAPWSAGLETALAGWASGQGIECKRFAGYLLHNPEDIRTGGGRAVQGLHAVLQGLLRERTSTRPPASAARHDVLGRQRNQ